MSSREDLIMKKARLVERIGQQRLNLANDVASLGPLFRIAGNGLGVLGTLRANPGWVALAAGILVAARPKRALAWARRGFVIWRTFRWARSAISGSLSGTIGRI
jgi:hypothetical protein